MNEVFGPLSIAVVEDDLLIQNTLRFLLKGHRADFFTNVEEFRKSLHQNRSYDLILLDLRHAGDLSGEITLSRIGDLRAQVPHAELVVQSGVYDVDSMRTCIRLGAHRFVLKDHLQKELPALLSKIHERRQLRKKLDTEIIGTSAVMEKFKSELMDLRFQPSVDVLIEGETGSGKELSARALHVHGPWVAVNVSAIPPELFESEFFGAERGAFSGAVQARQGYLEAARKGTLFLDEIQSLCPAHQAKLLRVLENREYTRVGSNVAVPFEARVLSASNANLKEAVTQGLFREDLYFRLSALTLRVPPLRTRGSDIRMLTHKFLQEFDQSKTRSFTENGLSFLQSYAFPGNVRELRGLIRSLVIKSAIPRLDEVEMRELINNAREDHTSPIFSVDWTAGFDENVSNFEKHLLSETLRQHKSVDARLKLKLARSRFYEKTKQYALLKTESRPPDPEPASR